MLLKDEFLNGILDSNMQDMLLEERGLTVDKCVNACDAAESAAKQEKEMLHSEVNRVYPRSS